MITNINKPLLYNRQNTDYEYENTIKIEGLAFLYKTTIGRIVTHLLLKRPFISKLYGRTVRQPKSKKQIKTFIEHYNINIKEIEQPLASFTTFNDFFIRKLKPEARPVDQTPHHLISPADARLLVFDLSGSNGIPVKGYWYTLADLLKDKLLAEQYEKGICMIYRLAPSDYHRFHYIDEGTQAHVIRIKGVLNSVHPVALSSTKALLSRNYREITTMHTANFGNILQIEVGALLVGRIIQQHRDTYTFDRGEEKGYFDYGGSTVIQLFKPDVIEVDSDILRNSEKQTESLVKMGEKVGVRKQ